MANDDDINIGKYGCLYPLGIVILYFFIKWIFKIENESLTVLVIAGCFFGAIIYIIKQQLKRESAVSGAKRVAISPVKASQSKAHASHASDMELIELTGSMLANFFNRLQSSDEFVRFIHTEVNGLENLDSLASYELISGKSNRLVILFFSDFCKVYRLMGELFSYQHDKAKPLEYAITKLKYPKFTLLTFPSDRIYELYESARVMLMTMNEISCETLSGDYEFSIATMLESAGMTRTADDYLTALLSYAKNVAQIGAPSKKNTEYIVGFRKAMKASEGPSSTTDKLKEPQEELNGLIGLDNVKKEISRLIDFITINQMRRDKGLKTSPISYHCVFTGNPGTGKTTVARIVADIYRELGIIKKGHLVETDRSGLVAEYVGQTAVKTNKIIDKALDGVLFIDEAYSLVPTASDNDYGHEAIATLLKRMEDDRDRLVVILAGYGDEMRRFIESNPGLESRFNRYINFEDYSAESLYEIFLRLAERNEYILNPEAQAALQEVTRNLVATKDRNFGNARSIRNLFEKVIEHQAHRLSQIPNNEISSIDLQTITATDLRLQ